MHPFVVPPLVVLTALGAAMIARWAVREFHRVNSELDSMRTARATESVDRSRLPTLRRDPTTGEYRPQ
jgi:hypothetical protein